MGDLPERLRHRVIPAVPTPFDSGGAIDTSAIRTYARWMAQQPVGAVALWAHTGRGLQLTDAQRSHVLAIWTEALGETPAICGVGVPRSERLPGDAVARTDRVVQLSVAMAEAAREGGASAVLVYPPTPLRDLGDRDRRVLEVHRAVAAVGLPVIAFYLYEAAGGISYSPNAIEELLHLDGVIGIKLATLDSVMTFQDIGALVSHQEDALLISGEDRFLGYSLTLGTDAALVGMAAACTDRCVALLDAWYERDLPTFVRLTAVLDNFSRATFSEPMEGYVQRMLWALEADGVIPVRVWDPFAPGLAEGERDIVAQAVRDLRLQ